jgi:uncharacterized protein YkwD
MRKYPARSVATLFFRLWIICTVLFVINLGIATRFFSISALDTPYGNSSLYLNIFLGTFFIGCVSFVLGCFFKIIGREKVSKSTIIHRERANKGLSFKTTITFAYAILALAMLYLSGKYLYAKGFQEGREARIKEMEEVRETASNVHTTLWTLINEYRQNKGLPVLEVNSLLCELAQKRSQEITSDWSHDKFKNNTPILYEKYCPGCYGMGENLAMGYFSSNQIFDAWIKSPTHKEILDTNYTKGCLGITENDGLFYVSLNVGK